MVLHYYGFRWRIWRLITLSQSQRYKLVLFLAFPKQADASPSNRAKILLNYTGNIVSCLKTPICGVNVTNQVGVTREAYQAAQPKSV
jgi:hypothetical protein